jgi:uncharacterized OB-fold protein
MEGRGSLSGFTCISVVPPAMADEGFSRKNPYCVGVVTLQEGVKVVARIDGIDASKPELIKVGMPVGVSFLHPIEGEYEKTYLGFRPA